MQSPKVSIVTPSFNQAKFLPQTLASVQQQDYPNIEHIVVDGGSTDGSVEILQKSAKIRWISQPDRGQVNALNKGFAMATGEIFAWLNSDDTMNPNTVGVGVAALQKTGADLVYGDVEIVDENGNVLKISRGIPFDFRILLYGINYIGQQTAFFRRSLWEKSGPLREEFDNAFDYELWLRMSQHGKFAYVPELRAQIRYHAAAKSVARNEITRADRERIRAEYWKRGGWPELFRHRALFWWPNFYYRLKRQIFARLIEARMAK
jgi:glycosyltransferase involved in cell wall biosynthesis